MEKQKVLKKIELEKLKETNKQKKEKMNQQLSLQKEAVFLQKNDEAQSTKSQKSFIKSQFLHNSQSNLQEKK